MISMTKKEKRAAATECYRAFRSRTGMMQCEGCEIGMYCPSEMENWDGEKTERENGIKSNERRENPIMVILLCNLLIFLRGEWIFIPANNNVKVETYWRNCGRVSIRSELFVRITSGYSRGALVSKKLLRPPGIW